MQVNVKGDGHWPALGGQVVRYGQLHGMALRRDPGAAVVSDINKVAIRVEMPDGTAVMCETTLTELWAAVNALNAGAGDCARRDARVRR